MIASDAYPSASAPSSSSARRAACFARGTTVDAGTSSYSFCSAVASASPPHASVKTGSLSIACWKNPAAFLSGSGARRGQEVPASHVEVVRLEVDGGGLHQGRGCAVPQLAPQGLDDRPCDLVLHREDALQLAVVGIRPHVHVVGDVDELRRHPQGAPLAPHAPLEQGIHLQALADLA